MTRYRLRSHSLLLLLLVPVPTAPVPAQEDSAQTGIASYYADEFHGRKTANGETYDMHAMTAAHPTLPFNSLVKVTNLGNRKTAVVRINDAGPFLDERIIDLSFAAAKKLGMHKSGKARVRLEVIGSTDPDAGNSNVFYKGNFRSVELKGYAVQLGSYNDLDNLIRRMRELTERGIPNLYIQPATVKGASMHRIVAGPFAARSQAVAFRERILLKGIRGFVFQIR